MTTRPSARYGSRNLQKPTTNGAGGISGKVLAILMVAIIAVALIFAGKYFLDKQKVNASISYVTHEVLSDDEFRIWVDVTRNRPEEPAYCIVQAYDYDKAEVGRREVPLPPHSETNQRIAVDIDTTRRAVAGGVYGCSSEIPSYMDIETPHFAN